MTQVKPKNPLRVYCEESSIHGIPFLVNRQIHWIEKLFWLVALIISFICCSILIYKIGVKVREDLTVIYSSEHATNITEIPFPAVTYCPELLNKFGNFNYNFLVGNLTSGEISIEDLTETELKYMQAIALVTGDEFLLDYTIDIDASDVTNYILNITWDWTGAKIRRWKHTHMHFDDYWTVFFSEIITPFGYCYSFNNPYPNEFYDLDLLPGIFNYSREIAFYKSIVSKFYIRSIDPTGDDMIYPFYSDNFKTNFYAMVSYKSNNLQILDNDLFQEEYITEGFKFFIHNPYDVLSKDTKFTISKVNYSIQHFLTPSQTLIDSSLTNYNPKIRGCYFSFEKSLKFFKNYTKTNCRHECLANATISTCKCAQFYMVRDKDVKICGIRDMSCYKTVETQYNLNDSCSCLFACEEVIYNFDVLQIDHSREKETSGFSYVEYQTMGSEVIIRYKSDSFNPFILKRQFTELDFISYTGGALGLFLGFSVLSFVEIIYYFTVRVCFEKYRLRRVGVQPLTNDPVQRPNLIKDYFNSSSIHGMNQVVFNRRHLLERLLWFSFLSLALIYGAIATINMFKNYRNSPLIMTYEDKLVSVDEIPFPAVTINNALTIQRVIRSMSLFWNFAPSIALKYIAEQQEENEDYFHSTFVEGTTCDNYAIIMVIRTTENFDDYPMPDWAYQIKKRSRVNWFQNQSAVFNGKYSPEFVGIFTTFSYGMTFNMAPADQLFNRNISEDFLGTEKFRLKAFDENIDLIVVNQTDYPLTGAVGLKFHFDPHPEEYWIWENVLCKPMKFLIHSPYEIPGSDEETDYCLFYHGNDLEVLITPEIIKSDESLRSYSPERRKCYFEDERPLKYFKIYTKKNCQTECFSNFTLKFEQTECVQFFQIRNQDDKVCDYRYFKRTRKALEFYEINKVEKSCNCLDDCNSIKYNIEIISSDLEVKDIEEIHQSDNNLVFKYKYDEFISLRRYQPFTFNEFLSQSGGLLGLFAGISMLSITEFFYYFSFRLMSNLVWRRNRRV